MVAIDSDYLMVENNVYDAEIALFDLEEHGMADTLHIARDGAEALDYLFAEDGFLRAEPPKVIFLDLHMPKMNGLEFLRRIRSDERTKGIPVVVLKSSTSPSELQECQRLGVTSFVRKPLNYESFVISIRNADT
jgi:two-component system response regulator